MAICCVSLILRRCSVPLSTLHSLGLPASSAGEKRRGGPRKRDFADSTCIYLPAEASAQAGPFLSNLEKLTFKQSTGDTFPRSRQL
jgi:hypothetical protein